MWVSAQCGQLGKTGDRVALTSGGEGARIPTARGCQPPRRAATGGGGRGPPGRRHGQGKAAHDSGVHPGWGLEADITIRAARRVEAWAAQESRRDLGPRAGVRGRTPATAWALIPVGFAQTGTVEGSVREPARRWGGGRGGGAPGREDSGPSARADGAPNCPISQRPTRPDARMPPTLVGVRARSDLSDGGFPRRRFDVLTCWRVGSIGCNT